MQWIHIGQDFNQVNGENNENDAQVDRRDVPDQQKYRAAKAHGTAMLSGVSGALVGVSKKVKPILVRLPQRRPSHSTSWTPQDFIDGLSAVADHYSDDSSTTRAILVLAIYYPPSEIKAGKGWKEDFNAFLSRSRQLLERIVAKGILPVVGTGNNQCVSIKNKIHCVYRYANRASTVY